MLILFPKKKGVKIATTIIFQAMQDELSYQHIMGMINFASQFGAITEEECKALIAHLNEQYRLKKS